MRRQHEMLAYQNLLLTPSFFVFYPPFPPPPSTFADALLVSQASDGKCRCITEPLSHTHSLSSHRTLLDSYTSTQIQQVSLFCLAWTTSTGAGLGMVTVPKTVSCSRIPPRASLWETSHSSLYTVFSASALTYSRVVYFGIIHRTSPQPPHRKLTENKQRRRACCCRGG